MTVVKPDPGLRATAPRRLDGGRLLAEMLRLHGVGPMFGMGGFQLLPFYGGIRELGLEHHLIADERSGAWAADAYARVTGRVGVCDATLGPGATNLVTALVESLNAGVPVVAIVGDTIRRHSGKNMTQEAEQVRMLRPAVKDILRVEATDRIPELVRRAFGVATSGRPGPVVLDVPEDVCHGEIVVDEADLYSDPVTFAVPGRRSAPDPGAVEDAAALLAGSKRPLILAGGGVHSARAYRELERLAEALAVPVAHTISGKGGIACTHPLSVGVFGRYSRIANDLIAEADCLLAVGAKLGEIATRRYELIPASVPMIQLDVLPEEIGRSARVDVGLVGDAALGLESLLLASAELARPDRAAYLAEVTARRGAWFDEAKARLTSSETPISVARLCHELNAVMPPGSVLVADGGFASHWTALLYDTKVAGRGYVADRGFASIGYGLPGAIGARLGVDDTAVVGVTGDGGLNMSLGELETAARIGRPFTLVVVNNAASGYVKALQHGMLGGAYQSADLGEIDYAEVAPAFGWRGIRVDRPEALRAAISDALAETARPVVVDVKVTRDPSQMLPGVDNRLAAMARERSA
jgi:acetolactate synthase-1/2/3 large subunit